MDNFLSEAKSLHEYTRALRRDFHKNPEMGFQEFRTSGIVARELQSFGLEVATGIGGTGVVALIEGDQPGPVILVRADMDALPIIEETGADYASQNHGVMHACGHDAHTAILLTTAKLLVEHRHQLIGTVKIVFQPAEEGLGGAERMITDGVLENPTVDLALALHVWNEKPLGWIGIPSGPAMAGGEIFKIKVIGKGGHGAAPHLSTDPILASGHILTALQAITSRNTPPLQAAVVSVCTIHAGETFNVIPPSVEMTGTIRSFEPSVRELVIEAFNRTIISTANAFGCQAEIDLKRLTPAVINHTPTSLQVQNCAKALFPRSQVDGSNYATMGSEDMAYIMEKVPGAFIFMGSANAEKGLNSSHHHPKFDIDEDVLYQATALMVGTITEMLK